MFGLGLGLAEGLVICTKFYRPENGQAIWKEAFVRTSILLDGLTGQLLGCGWVASALYT
jgi:hypothetical protein